MDVTLYHYVQTVDDVCQYSYVKDTKGSYPGGKATWVWSSYRVLDMLSAIVELLDKVHYLAMGHHDFFLFFYCSLEKI
jgi:hypothetical protein